MRINGLPTILVLALAAVSLYLFSRFTVDDAFISWRYGKNLIDFGLWNYNPSTFDLTQAYTSPIYAALSIVPNLFGWDVVLFFKILSTALLLAFVYWFARKTKGAWLMILALVGLPATVIHVYGGLETFLFVFLAAALLIAAYEERMYAAIILSLLLFMTRPEAWTLVAVLPVYFLISEPKGLIGARSGGAKYSLKEVGIFPARFAVSLLCLAAPLAAYFMLHYHYFGSALPNTFYVKLSGAFSPANSAVLVLVVLPIAILLPIGSLLYFGRIKIALLIGAVFGAMLINYSMSNLQMNYAGRFAFHIFVPIYLFFVYLASRLSGQLYISRSKDFRDSVVLSQSSAAKILLLFTLAAFASISDNFSTRGVTYYPRALFAHAALGKVLNRVADRYGIRGFAFADAGLVAYHSKLNALDSIGLASTAVARGGLGPALLEEYKVDLVVFHATAEGIRLDVFNQQKIYDWAIANNFRKLCDIYWQKDYILSVYSKTPIVEISEVCATSKTRNNVTDRELLKSAILVPPWRFWTE